MNIKTFDDLLKEVHSNGGLLTIGMWALRNMQGAGRIGERVLENIERELAARGLRHQPAQLPKSKDEVVRVFVAGSHIGKLIEAAHDLGEDADETLRSYAEAAGSTLRRRIEEVVKLADALGPNDPGFDMKRFSDDLSGETN